MFEIAQKLLRTPQTLAEQFVLGLLEKGIQQGHLTVVDLNGKNHSFGILKKKKKDHPEAKIVIKSPRFYLRIILFSALGLGEAYMFNDFEADNLNSFLMILAINRDALAVDGNHTIPFVGSMMNWVLHSKITNTIINSLSNIQEHYDLGNEIFEAFLDKTMTYSCPIWNDKDEPLEQAQLRKIRSLLDRAFVQKGQLILEIGTGWGSLAILAVKEFQCKVVTITLSIEQQKLAQERIEKLELQDQITVLLIDYRDMDPSKYQFDRIISCEMIEAVGPEFLVEFFQVCDRLLTKDGVISMQAITMPEDRYENYLKKTDFIQKHIFPGGHCPTLKSLNDAAFKATKGQLALDDNMQIGIHYAKALRLWNERFTASFDEFAEKSGSKDLYSLEFKRKWQFYFAYCYAGFATRTLGVQQIRFCRPSNFSLVKIAGIPL